MRTVARGNVALVAVRGTWMSEITPLITGIREQLDGLRPHERGMLERRLDALLEFLNAPGDWGYDTPMADLTLYLLKFRDGLNRP
jgi:hypothetical protein